MGEKKHVHAILTKAETEQLKQICQHYGMNTSQVMRALIKREALRIAK